MALFQETVTKWQADSWKRIHEPAGDRCVLNTNRMSDIRDTGDGNTATLYYFDNKDDHRDSGDYMVIHATMAELIVLMNTPLVHNSITLNVYTNNDPTLATTAVEISCENFAYALTDMNSIAGARTWVVYAESGWDIKKVLTSNSLNNIVAQAMS